MSKKDVTSLVQRLDAFEERLGVRIEALSAFESEGYSDDEVSPNRYPSVIERAESRCFQVARKNVKLRKEIAFFGFLFFKSFFQLP